LVLYVPSVEMLHRRASNRTHNGLKQGNYSAQNPAVLMTQIAAI
jgi:hypothetical protein